MVSGRLEPRRGAGDVMLHPVVVGSVLVLLTNDHILKQRWPSVLTGKLSDAAGLVFFPILLVAVAEICRSWTGLPPPSRRFVATCVALTGLVFAAAEIVPVVDGALELAWGWTRWPLDALTGRSVRRVVMVADPTDLLTLPALWIAWALGSTRVPSATERLARTPLGSPRHRSKGAAEKAGGASRTPEETRQLLTEAERRGWVVEAVAWTDRMAGRAGHTWTCEVLAVRRSTSRSR